MVRLAGVIECPGWHDTAECRICHGVGTISAEGKTTDTIRFWIAWKRRND